MAETILFRVEDADKLLIRNLAKQHGLSIAAFCRFLVFQSIRRSGGETDAEQ